MKRYGWMLAAALTLAACGDSTGPEIPTVTGQWSGPLDGQTTLTLTLSEAAEGAVTGSGHFTTTGGSISVTVESGTHSFPSLSLVLGQDGFEDVNLTGSVTASYIEATLNGSGFSQDEVILAKR